MLPIKNHELNVAIQWTYIPDFLMHFVVTMEKKSLLAGLKSTFNIFSSKSKMASVQFTLGLSTSQVCKLPLYYPQITGTSLLKNNLNSQFKHNLFMNINITKRQKTIVHKKFQEMIWKTSIFAYTSYFPEAFVQGHTCICNFHSAKC